MELRDFIVTPVVIFIVYVLAYLIRPRVTDLNTRKYFIPALTVKIIGALAVGFIYQFYYGGGDTFAYHTYGSRVIWEAFMDDPITGLKLFFNSEITTPGVYEYARKIWYYNDPNSFTIIQFASFFDLLTFSTYSATAVFFAVFSFSGVWALYLTFYHKYKESHWGLALAILFVPTVFFWGSGILKDSITIGLLGWMTYSYNKWLIERRYITIWIFILIVSGYLIYSIKVYIILSYLPALLLWFYFHKIDLIRSRIVKYSLAPFFLAVILFVGFKITEVVGENDAKYQFSNLAETARITAYDIRFGWGARFGEGSGYFLGELDGSFASLFSLAPAAINVSLFRPYLWEVQNPFMFLSALESIIVLLCTVWLFFNIKVFKIFRILTKPEIIFCLLFALTFAFAVGISTYNFGTLSRYKIPMMPFYLSALVLVYSESKREIKSSELEINE